MLKVFKGLLVNFSVEHVVHSIHLRFPILLVHVPLLLHLPHRITILLDVNFVRSTLHCQAIDLFTQFQDVTLVFTQTTLHTTHPEIKCAKTPRGFCTAELSLLFNSADLLESLLLLLTDIILQACLCICNISLQVTPHHSNFIEAVAQGVL